MLFHYENHVDMPGSERFERRLVAVPAVSQEEIGVTAVIGSHRAHASVSLRYHTRRAVQSDRKSPTLPNFPVTTEESASGSFQIGDLLAIARMTSSASPLGSAPCQISPSCLPL